jgi:hypothetical protein
MYAALNFHVLRTASGFELVPKVSMSAAGTYLDVREFRASDWSEHKQVVAAIVQAKKEHLLKDSAVDQISEGINGWINRFDQPGS